MDGWGWGGGVNVPCCFESIFRELEFLNFLTPHIDSTESILVEKSISLLNGFLETSIQYEDIEDFRIVVVICCVWSIQLYTEANLRFLTHRFQDPPLKQLELLYASITKPGIFEASILN